MAIEYTTERGVTVTVVPIPLMLDELRRAWEKRAPKGPVIIEHLAGGAEQEHEITEDEAEAWQAEDPAGWAEHAEAWTAYQVAVAEWNRQMNDAMWQTVCSRAIQAELSADDSWIEEHRLMGFDVPDSLRARRVHWIRTEAVGGIHDMLRLTALASGTDIDQEALQAAEDSFRDSLQRTLTGGLAAQGGAVANQRADGDATGGEGMGA